ncbi:hypothetical protein MW887_010749 [Aspergillus wentii]|nr:hypothetical protein MW887_010749 [Aspergillus wentii]
MGPSVGHAVEELPNTLIKGSGYRRRYPVWMAKSILRQTLLGIEFLHQNGISHGDMQQRNLLFSVKDLSSISEDELAGENEASEPVRRLDGKEDIWAPKYLALNESLVDYADVGSDFKIKISDLGAAFFVSDPPKESFTPVGLRSPELVFENKINKDQDIWSFGCSIYELLTGKLLFAVADMGDDEEIDDDHFLQFHDILGPLPGRLIAQYPRAHLYCNEAGEIITRYIGKIPEGADPAGLEPLPSLEECFDKKKPAELSDEEAGVVKKLLRWILDYDPAKRPSASELLAHPWFAEDAQ